MIALTNQQRLVLAHVVIDPDEWLSNAIDSLGEDEAIQALLNKVARVKPNYLEAVQTLGREYKNRVQRDSVI